MWSSVIDLIDLSQSRKEKRMRLNDLISRQEAINKILEYFIEYHGGAFREDDQRALIEVFKKLQTVDAEPVRHGHWIDEGLYNDDFPYHAWKCSECGEYVIEIDVPWYKFCPECGAKMERKEK